MASSSNGASDAQARFHSRFDSMRSVIDELGEYLKANPNHPGHTELSWIHFKLDFRWVTAAQQRALCDIETEANEPKSAAHWQRLLGDDRNLRKM